MHADAPTGYSTLMSNTHSNRPLGAPVPDQSDTSAAAKDPEDWVTGDEPMTAAQRSDLDTLAREAGAQLDPDMSKAEASEHIERLQKKTGRGQ